MAVGQQEFKKLISQNGWLDIPDKIATREGYSVNTSGDNWSIPYVVRDHSKINFGKIAQESLRWCTKRYVLEKLKVTSSHAGYSSFTHVWTEFLQHQKAHGLIGNITHNDLKSKLIGLVEASISKARSDHRLWALYRPIQWYLWCADNYPELGFCQAYALELDGMSIPGNPKGEAVKLEDPDRGPLHRSVELPLLVDAMRSDKSQKLEHLQQKAAVALSIALGRNPANLTYLRETDLVNVTPELDESCYIIKMPRIKKRQINPRDDLLEEHLDPEFAGYIKQLIKANRSISTTIKIDGGMVEIEKPLFINPRKNRAAMSAGMYQDCYNMTSEGISNLLRAFVKRHIIVSPLTDELLHISTRRLRYTLATGLAAEGISKRELARILDHTDTQHVQVYFELAGNIVEHLDKATAKGFAKYLNYFKGKVIDDDSEAVNGDRDDKHLAFIDETNPADQTEIGVCGENAVCHLDPPYSCYICPKFQPYRHADHEHVLERLLADRDTRMKKYENARLGIQLDQVIVAVAQVAEQCKLETAHA